MPNILLCNQECASKQCPLTEVPAHTPVIYIQGLAQWHEF